jgi:hypothetical protein
MITKWFLNVCILWKPEGRDSRCVCTLHCYWAVRIWNLLRRGLFQAPLIAGFTFSICDRDAPSRKNTTNGKFMWIANSVEYGGDSCNLFCVLELHSTHCCLCINAVPVLVLGHDNGLRASGDVMFSVVWLCYGSQTCNVASLGPKVLFAYALNDSWLAHVH